jgi:nitroimidazol reductase NimA-like FMN-containing flavoprotein (pyridoxamine 5'-phosphate oxidase superfamily)
MPRLSESETLSFLGEPGRLVRVGTVDHDGVPLVSPAWYLVDDGRIWVTPRARSTWLRHLERHPAACFTIDEEAGTYRKVIVRGNVEIRHRPGDDDLWRDLYRRIVLRYWAPPEADAYLASTRHLTRALIALPFDFRHAGVTTWRLPAAGEDPAGIWAPRYWEPVGPADAPGDLRRAGN